MPFRLSAFRSARSPLTKRGSTGAGKRRLAIEPLETRTLLAAYDLLAGVADGAVGSLRETVLVADANGEDDTIRLGAGTYALTLGGDEAGDLDITERGTTLVIIGAGADKTFLRADSLDDRLFDVASGARLVLIGVTLVGGAADEGGAIRNLGDVELQGVELRGNSADVGGAVYSVGKLTLRDTVVTGNTAADNGGGIASSGSLAILGSTVTGNTAGEKGDNVWTTESAPGATEPSGGASGSLLSLDSTIDWSLGYIDIPASSTGVAIDVWRSTPTTLEFIDFTGGARLIPGDFLVSWPTTSAPSPQFEAGTLTAGSINDHADIEAFAEFLAETLEGLGQGYFEIDLGAVHSIVVTGAGGSGLGDAAVTIYAAGDGDAPVGDPLLVTRTGSNGRLVFATGVDGVSASGRYVVQVVAPDGTIKTSVFDASTATWEIPLADVAAALPTQLDIALVIDTTGSMMDELEYLKIEIDSIVTQVRAAHPDTDIRFSLVAYRDQGDVYVTRSFDFTDSLEDFRELIAQQFASGGGDYPEAMHLALAESANFNWRNDGTAKMLFLVADAPPHADQVAATMAAVESLREQGVHIYPVGASGVATEAEYVMRSAAFLTSGQYLFLTNHSGYGLPHAEPSTDEYDVERLTQLMVRMIAAELAGAPVAAQEVIDHVVLTGAEPTTPTRTRPPLRPRLGDTTAAVRSAALLLTVDATPADVSTAPLDEAFADDADSGEGRTEEGELFSFAGVSPLGAALSPWG